MKTHKSPLSAIIDGAIAGAAGSYAIGLFFQATQRVAPKEETGFVPPEEEQKREQPAETVARRIVEGLAHTGPISEERKKLGGQMLHYGFGAAWGALYGATAESFPMFTTPAGAALFGTKVWAMADMVLLPMFGLDALPTRHSVGHHVYSWAAHVAYGATVMTTYRALSNPLLRPFMLASAAALLLLKTQPERTIEEPVYIEEPIEPYATEPTMQPSL